MHLSSKLLRFMLLLVAAVIFESCAGAPKTRLGMSVRLHGRVVDFDSGRPISDATVIVYVRRVGGGPGVLNRAELKSDSDGKFEFKQTRVLDFLVEAYKEGYQPNAIKGKAYQLMPRSSDIALISSATALPLEVHDDLEDPEERVGIRIDGPEIGFIFAENRVTEDLSEADITTTPEFGKKDTPKHLIAQGEGGFAPIETDTIGDWTLYNVREAPAEGYQKRLDLDDTDETFYAFRTRDGQHYGLIELTTRQKRETGRWVFFRWVYQPDGSRQVLPAFQGEFRGGKVLERTILDRLEEDQEEEQEPEEEDEARP